MKDNFDKYFSELQTSIEGVGNENSEEFGELKTRIGNARIELHNELKKIASWFTRTTDAQIDKLGLDDLIAMSIEMVKNIYPTTDIDFNQVVEVDDMEIKGESIKSIAEVLFNVLVNVVNHSEQDGDKIKADIRVYRDNNILMFESNNECGTSFDSRGVKKKLRDIRKEVDGLELSDKVKKEKGTGLVKIAKILVYDLNSHKPEMEIEDNLFKIKIPLEIKEVLV